MPSWRLLLSSTDTRLRTVSTCSVRRLTEAVSGGSAEPAARVMVAVTTARTRSSRNGSTTAAR